MTGDEKSNLPKSIIGDWHTLCIPRNDTSFQETPIECHANVQSSNCVSK